jgi:hypothetical protein
MSQNGRTIWKFPLQHAIEQCIDMHRSRRLLTVQVQNNIPTLWAVVDPNSAIEHVYIRCCGTGGLGPEPEDTYIGTVQIEGFVRLAFL